MKETQSSQTTYTKLRRIAEAAKRHPERAFTTLAHHIDIAWLREAYRRTRKDGATGIDGKTSDERRSQRSDSSRYRQGSGSTRRSGGVGWSAVNEGHKVFKVREEWMTPAGRPRTVPMYETTVSNGILGKSRTIKGKDRKDVLAKARAQLDKWAQLEAKQRAEEDAAVKDELAKQELAAIRTTLPATLLVDDRLDWGAMLLSERFPPPIPFEPCQTHLAVEPRRRSIRESRDILEGIGEQNLAAMDWEDFEQLVRELCSRPSATCTER